MSIDRHESAHIRALPPYTRTAAGGPAPARAAQWCQSSEDGAGDRRTSSERFILAVQA